MSPPVRSSGGFAFVMALLVALLVAGITTTLAVVSATESRISWNYIVHKQTTYLAEAGIQHALWQLSTDPTVTTDLLDKGLGGNKYDVIITKVDDHRFDIQSWGRTAEAVGTGLSVRASVFPQSMNYAIATKEFRDDTHAAQIEGPVKEGPIREMDVDWDALAAAADWVMSGDQTFFNLFYEGVIYVRGDIWLHADTWINGTIISEHDIRIDPGNGRHAFIQAAPGMPALVAANDVVLGQDDAAATIAVNGFVYADHKIKVRECNRLWASGSMVCKDNFEIEEDCGEVHVQWDPDLRMNPPIGITQHDTGLSHSWMLLPGTWQTLADRSPFED